jgi:integrase
MLRSPEDEPRKRGSAPSARLMRAFSGRRIDTITPQEVTAFLDELDDFGLAPRTCNKYRSVISGIYTWAARADTYGLNYNPVSKESKRREADPGELVTYTPEQVALIARTMREGKHRGARMRAGGEHSKPENRAERAREDEQDAAAVIVAAFAGLRLGELVGLRWRDVDFAAQRIRVQRAYVMGELTSTKGRKGRSLPMSEQVAQALAKLGQRPAFTGPDDLVFAGADGEVIDGGALARRYKRARDAVRASDSSVPSLRWHDLRHTFGSLCAAAGVDVVSIQSWLGHSSIRTTQRYMHHAPSAGDAARLSAAFAGATAAVEAVA